MKRSSIKTAVLIPALSVLLVGISLMAAVAGIMSSGTAKDITNQLIEANVEKSANEFQELCGGVYNTLSAAVPVVVRHSQSGGSEATDREDVIEILSEVLMTNENMAAIWTCWEPDAFDGQDSTYKNTSFYDDTGRFVPYLYKEGAGYRVEALVDYEDPVAGEYYQGARNAQKPYMTNPYLYQIGGKETSICSLAIPIVRNGKTMGVVGTDIVLEDFMTLLNSAAILEDGYLFTLSPGGFIASHPRKELEMTDYTTTWMGHYSKEVDAILTGGGKFSAVAYSDVTDSDVVFSGTGVTIGDTGQYWLVCAAVPESTVNASSVFLLETIILMGAILIALVGTTVFLLFHYRLKGLAKLTVAAESIAVGSVTLEGLRNEKEPTKNEIALLEQAFFKMAEGIDTQAQILTKIAAGDYSMTVPNRSENDVIHRAINHLLDNTNQTLHQIDTAAGAVFTGSKQIAESAQSLAKGATEQASALEELSTAVSEITGKTNESARIAGEASALSDTIKEKAEKGSEQMRLMMQSVNEINEASAQIEKVIKVIDDIAFQTNILALNAAVEAARAGQHGKGFAVVAEEVRNLAAKSAASANDTGNMIVSSKEKAELGLVIAAETSESLNEIIDGINHSAEIVSRIEQAARQQAVSIAQINAGIEQVSQVVTQNSAAAEESAAASEGMSQQSEVLTQQTAQFILKA